MDPIGPEDLRNLAEMMQLISKANPFHNVSRYSDWRAQFSAEI